MVSSCALRSTPTWTTGCLPPPPPPRFRSRGVMSAHLFPKGTIEGLRAALPVAGHQHVKPAGPAAPALWQPPFSHFASHRRRVLPRVSWRFAAVLRGPSDAWESTAVDMSSTVPRPRYPRSPRPPQVAAWTIV